MQEVVHGDSQEAKYELRPIELFRRLVVLRVFLRPGVVWGEG